jgi:flagellar hook-associated protein 3 FlgL
VITGALTTVGATTNRLDLTKNKLDQDKVNLNEILSNVEDADMPGLVIKLKSEQNAYQAALMTGSMVLQTSLIDFLR